jgi:hypothetical protein
LKSLILYNKKANKIKDNNQFEIDLDELESFGIFKHGKEFLEIPDRKIQGKSIIEWFALTDISLWWFIAPTIHPKYKEGLLFIDRLLTILNDNKFDVLKLKGCFDKLEIIKQICSLRDIKLEISPQEHFSYFKQKMKNTIKKNAYKKIHTNKTKKRLNIFTKFSSYQKPPPGYVLFTSPGIYRRQTFDPHSGKSISKEYFIHPFLDFCSTNNIPTLCIDLDYTFRGNSKILEERIRTENNWIPVEYLLKNPMSNFYKNQLISFTKRIKELQSQNLSSIFSYNGISLWALIKPIMNEILLEPYLPTYLHLLEQSEQFLKETQPSVLIQTYEAGPYAKAFEVAASKLQIKSIALQHGLILSDTPDYFFKQIRTEHNPLGNIISDKTLVFGEYYRKKLMENSAYNETNIDVFGHPEYFDIKQIKSKLEKNKVRSRFNLPNKTIILVSLSFRFSYIQNSPDRVLLYLLYEKFKNSDDTIILVRPHPGDKLNSKILEKNFPTENFRISNGSLFEDLSLCDMVIILPISTVSTEAIMFDKPIIFADLIKKRDLEIDPIFKILIENKLAVVASESNLNEIIDSIRTNTTFYPNQQERENVKQYLSNFKCKPSIDKYIKYQN